jgi:hypothetical protein
MGYYRRIDIAMLPEIAFNPAADPVGYVCGSIVLVEHVAVALVEIGYFAQSICTERSEPYGEA